MKFSRLFFLENLKKKISKLDFLLFFKFQPMTARQWFSLRMMFKQEGTNLVVLKKRELLKFLGVQNNSKFTFDPDNICFTPALNFLFFLKTLNSSKFLNITALRPFLFKVNVQLLSIDYFKNLFQKKDLNLEMIFLENFMFLEKSLYSLKLNIFSSTKVQIALKNIVLKE